MKQLINLLSLWYSSTLAVLSYHQARLRGLLRGGGIALLVWLAATGTLSAQTTDHKPDSVALAVQPKSVDSLQRLAQSKLIDSLQHLLEQRNAEMQHMRQERDSLRRWADTLLMRTVETRIYRRYNEERIQRCLQDIDRHLVDKSLLNRFSKMMELLRDYGRYNAELRATCQSIEDAQLVGASMRSKANTERALQLIRQLPYYRLYYGKEWSIGYLDERIQLAIARIEETQRSMQKTTLKDIIDSL